MIIYCNDLVLAENVRIADNFASRFLGLMGKNSLEDGEGLLLMMCPSIHCFFMKISIDVIYISRNMEVLGIETLKPWSIGKRFRKTMHILEIKEGAASMVKVGDTIVLN
ncbi:MAG: DUF192 domain-containing protein [Aminipila sp.]